jgi:lipoprotein-anchoring transpeptidase ErfK/SrfK
MISRRSVLLTLAAPLTVGGCASPQDFAAAAAEGQIDEVHRVHYAAVEGEPFPVPAVNLRRIRSQLLRREVQYANSEQPGTIVVDPANYVLYLVRPQGRAIRYGVGVGREGFDWNGTAIIQRKAEWPTWTPPKEMIARDPTAAPWAKGMPGGPHNPLGARALYLYQNGVDTLYRIHGTNDPRSIGRSMSSGCVRLVNQDIIDLYRRTPVGSKVVVLSATRNAT